MITSGREAWASSGLISGSGLEQAKTMGFSAISLSSAGCSRFGPDRPTNTSAPLIASVRVRLSVSLAKMALCSFRSSRPAWITPLRSTMLIFSTAAPRLMSSFMQATAAAPAPRQTILASSSFLSASSSALSMAAAVTMAVPCWSSWNTGISHCSISARSISQHSGALMSARLVPPKVQEVRLGVARFLVRQLQRMEHGRRGNDGGTVLVIVEHGDIALLDQCALDLEALGRLDVLEVDTAKSAGDALDCIDEGLGTFRLDFDVEY